MSVDNLTYPEMAELAICTKQGQEDSREVAAAVPEKQEIPGSPRRISDPESL